MSKQFVVVRDDNAAVSVLTGDALHRFNRPDLDQWTAFVDGVSGNQLGTASLRLVRAIYGGKKADLDRLTREWPSLATAVSGEIAEILAAEAKKQKR